ncbi:hypothetical protein D3C74_373350 [compost metagenome]
MQGICQLCVLIRCKGEHGSNANGRITSEGREEFCVLFNQLLAVAYGFCISNFILRCIEQGGQTVNHPMLPFERLLDDLSVGNE